LLADGGPLTVLAVQKVEPSTMAPTIARRPIDPYRSLSADDLRRVFETAVSELHEADRVARKRLQYRTPIVQRRGIFGIAQASTEKRALTDAARALAQLWKV
jgi:hypothetical protein